MEYRYRKRIRLENYDYSANGAYFITICTKNREHLFWQPNPAALVGATIGRPPIGRSPNSGEILTELGRETEKAVLMIPVVYKGLADVCNYVVMPNHIHIIIVINGKTASDDDKPPTISRIIQQFKGVVSKKAGYSVWQKSFCDRIIRNEEEYIRISQYIDENPEKWEQDSLYEEHNT